LVQTTNSSLVLTLNSLTRRSNRSSMKASTISSKLLTSSIKDSSKISTVWNKRSWRKINWSL